MSLLRMSLFGRFRVQRGEDVLTDLYPRKLQELVSYLLLYRDRAHPRETLASLLWGDSSTAQSKKYLRQALWQLQTAINCRVLLVDPERIRVNPDAEFWLDVAVFERAFARAQGVPGPALDPLQVEALRQAVELHKGDLLEGWFQDWCLYERERLQNIYLALLDKLMDHCEATGEYEAGLVYGIRTLRCDGARERTHRRLMRLHYLNGDRTAALRQFDHCVEALRRELAVRPAARTVALYDQIRKGCFVASACPPVSGLAVPASFPSRRSEMLQSLKQLQTTLTEVQGQLQAIIHAVEHAETGKP